jgi:hypothetical protein
MGAVTKTEDISQERERNGHMHIHIQAIEGLVLGVVLITGFIASQIIQRRHRNRG